MLLSYMCTREIGRRLPQLAHDEHLVPGRRGQDADVVTPLRDSVENVPSSARPTIRACSNSFAFGSVFSAVSAASSATFKGSAIVRPAPPRAHILAGRHRVSVGGAGLGQLGDLADGIASRSWMNRCIPATSRSSGRTVALNSLFLKTPVKTLDDRLVRRRVAVPDTGHQGAGVAEAPSAGRAPGARLLTSDSAVPE